MLKTIQRQKTAYILDGIMGTSNRDFKVMTGYLAYIHTHIKDRINNTLKPFNSTYLHCGGLSGLFYIGYDNRNIRSIYIYIYIYI